VSLATPSRFAHDAPAGAFSFGVPREVSPCRYTECLYYFAASIPLAPGESCVWYLFFRAGEAGGHTATFGNLWNDGTRDFTPIANVKGSAFYET
jgi:hypothetical protein